MMSQPRLIGMPADKLVGETEAEYIRRKGLPQYLSALNVGDRIRFAEERQAYTVQAKGDRFLVCNKPFNALRTTLYTIVDMQELIRGPENLIFGAGAETRQQCEEMLARLEGKAVDLGFTTEISYRRSRPLGGILILPPSKRKIQKQVNTKEGETA